MSILKGVQSEVTVNVKAEITGDYGKKIMVPFKARYRRYTIHEAKELMDRVKTDDLDDETLINEVLLGWSDLRGNNNETVEFCPEALSEAMSVMGYRKALVEGFINQQFEIDTKNR